MRLSYVSKNVCFLEIINKQMCNIPLVSIGIIPVKGALEGNVQETHYSEECFTT